MEYKKLEQLLAHPENEQLLPPLTSDEYNGLKKSLSEKFKEIPLEIMEQDKAQYTLLTGEYIVLDGNNRLKILREIGYNKPIPVIIHKYMEEAKQRTFIENAALNKRNLTKEAKIEIAQRQVARGISQAQVAKTIGMSQQWVSEQTNEIKEVRKQAEVQAIQTLRESGISQKETANIIGVSERTIKTIDKDIRGNFTISGKIAHPEQEQIVLEDSNQAHEQANENENPRHEKSSRTPEQKAVRQVKAMLSEDAILKAAREIKLEKRDQKKRIIESESQAIEKVIKIENMGRPEIKIGDIWHLGSHILYCGNTTDHVFINMCKKERAALAFADPPYGVGVGKEDFEDDIFYWEHDYLIDCAKIVAVTPGTKSIQIFLGKTLMPYKWSIATFVTNGRACGALGFSNWLYTAVFSKEKSIHKNIQDCFSVAIDTSVTHETTHPTRKPNRYMLWLINNLSIENDIIIDPFLGSGTTLLACETSSRKCIGGEKNIIFCQEIIGRWERLTNKKAIKYIGE